MHKLNKTIKEKYNKNKIKIKYRNHERGGGCRIKLLKFAETCTHRTSYCKLIFSFHLVMVSCDCRRAKGKRIVLKR